MRKYLQSLPNRSVEHRKNFALLAAGGVTLIIFVFWALAHFGSKPNLTQNTNGAVNLASANVTLSPLENITSGFKDIWYSVTHLNGQ